MLLVELNFVAYLLISLSIKSSSTTFHILSLKMTTLSLSNPFLMSSDVNYNCNSSFHSHVTEMSEYFNLPDFNTDLLDTAIKKTS